MKINARLIIACSAAVILYSGATLEVDAPSRQICVCNAPVVPALSVDGHRDMAVDAVGDNLGKTSYDYVAPNGAVVHCQCEIVPATQAVSVAVATQEAGQPPVVVMQIDYQAEHKRKMAPVFADILKRAKSSVRIPVHDSVGIDIGDEAADDAHLSVEGGNDGSEIIDGSVLAGHSSVVSEKEKELASDAGIEMVPFGTSIVNDDAEDGAVEDHSGSTSETATLHAVDEDQFLQFFGVSVDEPTEPMESTDIDVASESGRREMDVSDRLSATEDYDSTEKEHPSSVAVIDENQKTRNDNLLVDHDDKLDSENHAGIIIDSHDVALTLADSHDNASTLAESHHSMEDEVKHDSQVHESKTDDAVSSNRSDPISYWYLSFLQRLFGGAGDDEPVASSLRREEPDDVAGDDFKSFHASAMQSLHDLDQELDGLDSSRSSENDNSFALTPSRLVSEESISEMDYSKFDEMAHESKQSHPVHVPGNEAHLKRRIYNFFHDNGCCVGTVGASFALFKYLSDKHGNFTTDSMDRLDRYFQEYTELPENADQLTMDGSKTMFDCCISSKQKEDGVCFTEYVASRVQQELFSQH